MERLNHFLTLQTPSKSAVCTLHSVHESKCVLCDCFPITEYHWCLKQFIRRQWCFQHVNDVRDRHRQRGQRDTRPTGPVHDPPWTLHGHAGSPSTSLGASVHQLKKSLRCVAGSRVKVKVKEKSALSYSIDIAQPKNHATISTEKHNAKRIP